MQQLNQPVAVIVPSDPTPLIMTHFILGTPASWTMGTMRKQTALSKENVWSDRAWNVESMVLWRGGRTCRRWALKRMVTITEVCVLASDHTAHSLTSTLQGLRMVMHSVMSIAESHQYYGTLSDPSGSAEAGRLGSPWPALWFSTGISETIPGPYTLKVNNVKQNNTLRTVTLFLAVPGKPQIWKELADSPMDWTPAQTQAWGGTRTSMAGGKSTHVNYGPSQICTWNLWGGKKNNCTSAENSWNLQITFTNHFPAHPLFHDKYPT